MLLPVGTTWAPIIASAVSNCWEFVVSYFVVFLELTGDQEHGLLIVSSTIASCFGLVGCLMVYRRRKAGPELPFVPTCPDLRLEPVGSTEGIKGMSDKETDDFAARRPLFGEFSAYPQHGQGKRVTFEPNCAEPSRTSLRATSFRRMADSPLLKRPHLTRLFFGRFAPTKSGPQFSLNKDSSMENENSSAFCTRDALHQRCSMSGRVHKCDLEPVQRTAGGSARGVTPSPERYNWREEDNWSPNLESDYSPSGQASPFYAPTQNMRGGETRVRFIGPAQVGPPTLVGNFRNQSDRVLHAGHTYQHRNKPDLASVPNTAPTPGSTPTSASSPYFSGMHSEDGPNIVDSSQHIDSYEQDGQPPTAGVPSRGILRTPPSSPHSSSRKATEKRVGSDTPLTPNMLLSCEESAGEEESMQEPSRALMDRGESPMSVWSDTDQSAATDNSGERTVTNRCEDEEESDSCQDPPGDGVQRHGGQVISGVGVRKIKLPLCPWECPPPPSPQEEEEHLDEVPRLSSGQFQKFLEQCAKMQEDAKPKRRKSPSRNLCKPVKKARTLKFGSKEACQALPKRQAKGIYTQVKKARMPCPPLLPPCSPETPSPISPPLPPPCRPPPCPPPPCFPPPCPPPPCPPPPCPPPPPPPPPPAQSPLPRTPCPPPPAESPPPRIPCPPLPLPPPCPPKKRNKKTEVKTCKTEAGVQACVPQQPPSSPPCGSICAEDSSPGICCGNSGLQSWFNANIPSLIFCPEKQMYGGNCGFPKKPPCQQREPRCCEKPPTKCQKPCPVKPPFSWLSALITCPDRPPKHDKCKKKSKACQFVTEQPARVCPPQPVVCPEHPEVCSPQPDPCPELQATEPCPEEWEPQPGPSPAKIQKQRSPCKSPVLPSPEEIQPPESETESEPEPCEEETQAWESEPPPRLAKLQVPSPEPSSEQIQEPESWPEEPQPESCQEEPQPESWPEEPQPESCQEEPQPKPCPEETEPRSEPPWLQKPQPVPCKPKCKPKPKCSPPPPMCPEKPPCQQKRKKSKCPTGKPARRPSLCSSIASELSIGQDSLMKTFCELQACMKVMVKAVLCTVVTKPIKYMLGRPSCSLTAYDDVGRGKKRCSGKRRNSKRLPRGPERGKKGIQRCSSGASFQPGEKIRNPLEFICIAKTPQGWKPLEEAIDEEGKLPDVTKVILGFDLKQHEADEAGSWDSLQNSVDCLFDTAADCRISSGCSVHPPKDTCNDEPATEGDLIRHWSPSRIVQVKRVCEKVTEQLNETLEWHQSLDEYGVEVKRCRHEQFEVRRRGRSLPGQLKLQHLTELEEATKKLNNLCSALVDHLKPSFREEPAVSKNEVKKSLFSPKSTNSSPASTEERPMEGRVDLPVGGIQSSSGLLIKFDSSSGLSIDERDLQVLEKWNKSPKSRKQQDPLQISDAQSRMMASISTIGSSECNYACMQHCSASLERGASEGSSLISREMNKTASGFLVERRLKGYPEDITLSNLFDMYQNCRKYLDEIEKRVAIEMKSKNASSSATMESKDEFASPLITSTLERVMDANLESPTMSSTPELTPETSVALDDPAGNDQSYETLNVTKSFTILSTSFSTTRHIKHHRNHRRRDGGRADRHFEVDRLRNRSGSKFSSSHCTSSPSTTRSTSSSILSADAREEHSALFDRHSGNSASDDTLQVFYDNNSSVRMSTDPTTTSSSTLPVSLGTKSPSWVKKDFGFRKPRRKSQIPAEHKELFDETVDSKEMKAPVSRNVRSPWMEEADKFAVSDDAVGLKISSSSTPTSQRRRVLNRVKKDVAEHSEAVTTASSTIKDDFASYPVKKRRKKPRDSSPTSPEEAAPAFAVSDVTPLDNKRRFEADKLMPSRISKPCLVCDLLTATLASRAQCSACAATSAVRSKKGSHSPGLSSIVANPLTSPDMDSDLDDWEELEEIIMRGVSSGHHSATGSLHSSHDDVMGARMYGKEVHKVASGSPFLSDGEFFADDEVLGDVKKMTSNKKDSHTSVLLEHRSYSSTTTDTATSTNLVIKRALSLIGGTPEPELPVLMAQPGIISVGRKENIPAAPYFVPTSQAPSIGPLLQSMLHNPMCAFYFDGPCADHMPKGSLGSYLAGFYRFVWNHEKRLAFYPEKLLTAFDSEALPKRWTVAEFLWNLLQGCSRDIADFESKKLLIGLEKTLPRFNSEFFGEVGIRATCPECGFWMETKTDVLLRSHPLLFSDPSIWSEVIRSDLVRNWPTYNSRTPSESTSIIHCEHPSLEITAFDHQLPCCLCIDVPMGTTLKNVPMSLTLPASSGAVADITGGSDETYELISVVYGKKPSKDFSGSSNASESASDSQVNTHSRLDTQSGCAFKHLKMPSRWFYVKDEQLFEILHNSNQDLSRKLSSRGIIALVYISSTWSEKEEKLRKRLTELNEQLVSSVSAEVAEKDSNVES